MRVCIFSHTFPRFPGDTAAPFMGNLAEALAKKGHKVFTLIPFDPQIKFKVKRPYKLKAYRYIFPDKWHKLGFSRTLQGDKNLKLETYILSPFLFLFGFLSLLNLVKKEKIECISAHWIIPNGFIASLVSKITGVPVTVTIPGSDIYLGGKNIFFRWMVGFAAKNANFVLSDSSSYIGQLNDLGFHPRHTAIIRYGVNAEKFKPTSKDKKIIKKLGLSADQPIIVAVGRLVAKKGFLYLIKAMPDVLKKIKNARLVIVGDGDQKVELVKEAVNLKVKDNVIFAGTISYDELSKYYNLGDICVMPSIKDEQGNIDASPVAMMEAMACGKPVVATKFSGSEDLVINGQTGFLVKEKNEKEISKAITSLLSKLSNDVKKLQKFVRKVAVDNFSTKSIAEKYSEIFNICKSV